MYGGTTLFKFVFRIVGKRGRNRSAVWLQLFGSISFLNCGCSVERCELDKLNLFPHRLFRGALGSASKFGFSEAGGGESPGRESSSRAAPGNRVRAG